MLDIVVGIAGTMLSVESPRLEPRPLDPESLHRLAGSPTLGKP